VSGEVAGRAPRGPGPTIPAVSVDHYENFPVASWLCPPRMQPAVRAIYHFARTADDLADEGDCPAAERTAALQHYRRALAAAAAGQPLPDAWPRVFGPLAQAIDRHGLPLRLLDDLLDAFLQDVGNPRYADRAQLLDYCSRSANPVGRLMLHLAGIRDAQALAESDAVCTALQLINFWQDPSVDLPRGRIYFPEADARRHGLVLDQLAAGQDSPASQALLRELCDWAGQCMRSGAPLARRVPGRLGWELRLVVQGGLRILERIEAMRYRSLSQRPALGRTDWPVMFWRACWMPRQTASRA
jgi:squalene synthase HpnC